MNTFRADSDASRGAYLVLQSGGRWSDVFRLTPPNEAVIGRSSACEIVLRSDQASRKHAKIAWNNDHWTITDLGSRNGTTVGATTVDAPKRLADGDQIVIAGFAITFSSVMTPGFGIAGANSADSGGSGADDQVTDDQMTMPIDVASITDRRRQSGYLHGATSPKPVGAPAAGTSGAGSTFSGPSGTRPPSDQLLKLAFALARSSSVAEAVETTLDSLSQSVPFSAAGIYASEKVTPQSTVFDATLLATRQTGSRAYRQPPVSLAKSITDSDGQAFLARNIVGDSALATQNSHGEIDVESIIVTPIRNSADQLLGMIHLTTSVGAAPMDSSHLEFTVAAAEILAEAFSNVVSRRTLSKRLKRSTRQIENLQKQLGNRVRMIGDSPAINQISEKISLAAPTNATVLVRGESGVGKELVAAAIHHTSPRSSGPLVCLNCAALSPTLLESELFGHEKGAFTGATSQKHGKFEAADGGTIMLDEIGEMSLDLQAKFLRVLEGHPYERLGGNQAITTNVRVVAATNRDLQSMVADGKFRQDLYYRLHVVEIIVPPLRDRADDAMLLADHFLRRFNQEMGRRIEGFTPEARQQLRQYKWPGNVRELKNVIERAVVLNTKTVIDASDLSLVATPSPARETENRATEMTLADLERKHIMRTLDHTKGNKSRASAILGIERSTLDRKLKRYKKDDQAGT